MELEHTARPRDLCESTVLTLLPSPRPSLQVDLVSLPQNAMTNTVHSRKAERSHRCLLCNNSWHSDSATRSSSQEEKKELLQLGTQKVMPSCLQSTLLGKGPDSIPDTTSVTFPRVLYQSQLSSPVCVI